MTYVSDRPPGPNPISGLKAYARLDSTASRPRSRDMDTARETITLNRIGAFLEIDFGRLFAWLRAGIKLALVLAVMGAVGAGAYGMLAQPLYTVNADILINPSKLQILPDAVTQGASQIDAQVILARSELRVLTSRNVLLRVVDELDLVNDKEFVNTDGGGFDIGKLFGGGGSAATQTDPRLIALNALAGKIKTTSDEKSFVVTLSVTAQSSDKAVAISNAVFTAFRDEQVKADAEAASRAASGLSEQLAQLKADVQDAEDKVEAYKRTYNLVTGDTGGLVSVQTMTQLNAQVVEAQGRVASAQAAYDAIDMAGANATTADTQASATLTALRATASSLQQQLNSEGLVLGPKHPTIVRLKEQMATANAQLASEVARVRTAAKATLDEAKSALAALTAQVDALKGGVFADNSAMVTLRQLERDATSKSTVYEGFLARARQVAEQEQIDTSNVRVISPPVPAEARSWPPRNVILLLGGAFAGLALGLLIAVIRGIARDTRARVAEQE